MGFFDVEEFSQDANDLNCAQHPLLNQEMTTAQKTGYLAGVAFSAFVIGGEKDSEVQRVVRKVAYALRLNDTDVKEINNEISSLKSNSDKSEFLKDSIRNLKERNFALFFCGDIMRVITSSTKESTESDTFLSGIVKMFMLDSTDNEFLAKMKHFLARGMEKKALSFIIELEKNSFQLPSGLTEYFFPTAMENRKDTESAKQLLEKTINLIRYELGDLYYEKAEKKLSVQDVCILKDFHDSLPSLESNSWNNTDFVSEKTKKLAEWFIAFCNKSYPDVDLEFISTQLFEQETQAVEMLECQKAPAVYLSSYQYGDFDMHYTKRGSEGAATNDARPKFAKRFKERKTEQIFIQWCDRAHFILLGESSVLDKTDTNLGAHLFNLLLLGAIKSVYLTSNISYKESLLKSMPKLSMSRPQESDCLKELHDWLESIASYCDWIEYQEYDALNETSVDMTPALDQIQKDMEKAYEWVCKNYLNEIADKNFVVVKEFVLSTAKEICSYEPPKKRE